MTSRQRRQLLLRAAAERRQVPLDRREGAVLSAVDRLIRSTWRTLLGALTAGRSAAVEVARSVTADLPARLRDVIADALTGLHAYAFGSTALDVAKALPATARAAAYARAVVRSGGTAPAAPPATVREFVGVVFPPPSREAVRQIVYRGPWPDRLQAITKLAPPDRIAATVARSFETGSTGQTLERELRPLLQNVQASSRRVVRTEAARVAQEARLAAYDGLGDLVIGYQIHAVRDDRTRPEHARRDGTIYYRTPGPGQLGWDVMPRPPLEADGSVAHNCRCWLTPVLRDLDE